MIRLEAEKLFTIYKFEITNTYLTAMIVLGCLIGILFFVRMRLSETPGKIQSLLEIFFEAIYNFWLNIVGKHNLFLFTFCLTFLIYILVSNWFGLLPGFGSLFVKNGQEKIPLLRSTYSDLNMTLALAIISVLGTNIIALVFLGRGYLKKFSGFVGGIELIGEVTRLLSFSLRLFGNIFAGETLLVILGLLLPFIIPASILFLESFVGLIQAIIFFVLTTVFISVALNEH